MDSACACLNKLLQPGLYRALASLSSLSRVALLLLARCRSARRGHIEVCHAAICPFAYLTCISAELNSAVNECTLSEKFCKQSGSFAGDRGNASRPRHSESWTRGCGQVEAPALLSRIEQSTELHCAAGSAAHFFALELAA